MTVYGYSWSDGDCYGNDIENLELSREKCGQVCYAITECVGYVYIVSGTKKFNKPSCYLKRKMCRYPHHFKELGVSSYFKSTADGKLLYLYINYKCLSNTHILLSM